VSRAVTINLPGGDGVPERYTLGEPGRWPTEARFTGRAAYAAARVVADPRTAHAPGGSAALDWDATLAHRRRLWALGFGVAEAMDTAQRGMGLDWPAAAELISRSAAEARACGGVVACGAGTDHAGELASLDEVVAAYAAQLEHVVGAGGRAIVMASRQLARLARHADDYAAVYGKVLALVDEPAILHWLGPMFDPQLAGYWGSDDLEAATETFLRVVTEHRDRIDGVKVSLLDRDHEVRLRAALPAGVRLYTGDDFHYPELIAGDGVHYSDALLGIFDAIAPAAAAALVALDAGDLAGYEASLAPTVPLARHVFAAPTQFYKTGLAFLGWVTGQQDAFTMIGGQATARSLTHLAGVFRLADAAGLLPDPPLAAARMRSFLAVHGIDG